jgi:hypothetical protein
VTFERAGGIALIAGTVAMLGVMGLHPSGVSHGSDGAHALLIGRIVHGVAIAAAPLLTFGSFALARHAGTPTAYLGFFFYLFGAVAVMLAASMSGLVAPRLIEMMAAADGVQKEALHNLLRLEWQLNQAFATVHVAVFSGAIGLLAVAWPGKGVLGAAIQMLGFVVAGGVFAWLASGTLTLNVHGMGAVVLAQGAWFVLAGAGLIMRTPRKGDIDA